MRTCLTCGIEKPPGEFQSKGKWGPDAHCKHCRRIKDRARYEASLTPEQRARKEWRKTATPEQRKARYLATQTAKRLSALTPERRDRLERLRSETPEQRKARLTHTEMVRRRAMFATVKDAPCMDCGRRFPPEAMDLDHVRGVKKKSVSRAHTWKQFREEVAKCELVCACCHRVRTARRRLGLPAVLPEPEYHI